MGDGVSDGGAAAGDHDNFFVALESDPSSTLSLATAAAVAKPPADDARYFYSDDGAVQ